MNFKPQKIGDIILTLINRNYLNKKAKRYIINHTNQNIWIPNKCLDDQGNVVKDISWIFTQKQFQHKVSLTNSKENGK